MVEQVIWSMGLSEVLAKEAVREGELHWNYERAPRSDFLALTVTQPGIPIYAGAGLGTDRVTFF